MRIAFLHIVFKHINLTPPYYVYWSYLPVSMDIFPNAKDRRNSARVGSK